MNYASFAPALHTPIIFAHRNRFHALNIYNPLAKHGTFFSIINNHNYWLCVWTIIRLWIFANYYANQYRSIDKAEQPHGTAEETAQWVMRIFLRFPLWFFIWAVLMHSKLAYYRIGADASIIVIDLHYTNLNDLCAVSMNKLHLLIHIFFLAEILRFFAKFNDIRSTGCKQFKIAYVHPMWHAINWTSFFFCTCYSHWDQNISFFSLNSEAEWSHTILRSACNACICRSPYKWFSFCFFFFYKLRF